MFSIAQKKEGESRILGIEAYIAILAIISITMHLVLRYLIPDLQRYSLYPLYITLALGEAFLFSTLFVS